MSRARIVQLLCPSGHCVIATAYQSPDGEVITQVAERLQIMFAGFVRAGANPWCGVCQSRDLHPVDRATEFETLVQAMPMLREFEERQKLTPAFLGANRG